MEKPTETPVVGAAIQEAFDAVQLVNKALAELAARVESATPPPAYHGSGDAVLLELLNLREQHLAKAKGWPAGSSVRLVEQAHADSYSKSIAIVHQNQARRWGGEGAIVWEVLSTVRGIATRAIVEIDRGADVKLSLVRALFRLDEDQSLDATRSVLNRFIAELDEEAAQFVAEPVDGGGA